MNSRQNLKAISPSKSSKLASYCPLSFFQLLILQQKTLFCPPKDPKTEFSNGPSKEGFNFYISLGKELGLLAPTIKDKKDFMEICKDLTL